MAEGDSRRSQLNDLDCIFCGRWFPTFSRLAEHVKRAHSHTRDATIISEIRSTVQPDEQTWTFDRPAHEERKRMARLPKPDTDTNSNNSPQFLKARDVGKLKSRAKMVIQGNVRVEDSQFGEQVQMDVLFNRIVWILAFRTNSPNYRMLYDRFGSKTAKWKGPIDVEVKHFNTNDYIAIVDPAKRTVTPGRRGAKKSAGRKRKAAGRK